MILIDLMSFYQMADEFAAESCSLRHDFGHQQQKIKEIFSPYFN